MLIAGSAFAQPAPGAAVAGNGVGSPFELSFWQSIATSEDKAQYEAYLAQYPGGTFSALARAKIGAIARREASVATVPSPVTVPAPAQPAAAASTVVAVIPVAAPPVAAVPAVPAPAPATSASAAVAPVAAAPAPVAAAPMTATVVSVTTVPVAAVPAAAPPAPVPGVATSPASPPSLIDQLSKLRHMNAAEAAQQAQTAAAATLPPRPQLAALPAISVPDHFCSADERNSFHSGTYLPAVATADQNNQAAIQHMRVIQAQYDQSSQEKRIDEVNALAKEAADYKPVADAAYADRNRLTEVFNQIMTTPISACH